MFKGAKLEKSKKLSGSEVLVGYFNGQIVAAVRNGKLTIMNESLRVIKEFAGSSSGIPSLCGNSTYLALCNRDNYVRYYKRNEDMESKVILLIFFSLTYFRVTSMVVKQIAFK